MPDLYTMEIIKLATRIPFVGRLDNPDVSVEKVSRVCGSKVLIDVKIEDGNIIDFAQEVKACALGQAACAIVGEHVLGMNEKIAERVRVIVKDLLAQGSSAHKIPPEWESLSILASAKDHKMRHSSILLIFDALMDAFRQKRAN